MGDTAKVFRRVTNRLIEEARKVKLPKFERFYFDRVEDESGVSGEGVVAVVGVYPSGRAVVEWVTKKTPTGSLGVYDSLKDVKGVHGHEGKTRILPYPEDA